MHSIFTSWRTILKVEGLVWGRRFTSAPRLGPLRDAAVGDACRAAFARDELSEDDDAVARQMYAGEARETAMTLMKHKNSKSARRFRRLTEALSKRKAGGRDL